MQVIQRKSARNFFPILLIITGLFCSINIFVGSARAQEKPKVVCTTGIMADLLRNLAGEQLNITPLMGPGVDPHVYKPTHKDISLLRGADIIVYHGLTLTTLVRSNTLDTCCGKSKQ